MKLKQAFEKGHFEIKMSIIKMKSSSLLFLGAIERKRKTE